MFVRKKKNKSGLISVQVIDKSSGKYKVAKTIGSSDDWNRIDELVVEGQQWIRECSGQVELDFRNENQLFSTFISSIRQVTVAGTEFLLGKIFDQIGFNQIQDDLFRQLVLARLCFPVSKLKTTDYLQQYHAMVISEDKIYRYLDKLYRINQTNFNPK